VGPDEQKCSLKAAGESRATSDGVNRERRQPIARDERPRAARTMRESKARRTSRDDERTTSSIQAASERPKLARKPIGRTSSRETRVRSAAGRQPARPPAGREQTCEGWRTPWAPPDGQREEPSRPARLRSPGAEGSGTPRARNGRGEWPIPDRKARVSAGWCGKGDRERVDRWIDAHSVQQRRDERRHLRERPKPPIRGRGLATKATRRARPPQRPALTHAASSANPQGRTPPIGSHSARAGGENAEAGSSGRLASAGH